ncbi:MAG: hypothetical protein JWP03_4245 [Phycisphaerales bacterium]|jgi:hypothetical protein|nr:hypothetical protein [Phycisphaerales bacterium]
MSRIFSVRLRPVALLLPAIALLATVGGGCRSQANLTVTSDDHRQAYTQPFTQAFCSRCDGGNVDVVLVDRAAEEAMRGETVTAPVKQVMHIQVLWTAAREMKAVTSNAAIKWYVIGSQPHDVLEYSGTAFVALASNSDGATLTIRRSSLKPAENHGTLTDPVGASHMEGTITAHVDEQTVNRLLGELQSASVAAAVARPSVARTEGGEKSIVP